MRSVPLKQKGFTLVEVMVVTVIIVIIAAVAIPAYNNHVKETRRTAAKATLLEMANAIEQHNARTGSFHGIVDGGGNPVSAVLPASRPATEFYQFSITHTTTNYTLEAIPVPQSPQDGTGTLEVNSQGERSWD